MLNRAGGPQWGMTRYDSQAGEPDRETLAPANLSSAVILPAREVPLGGLRAMTVFRTLPFKGLPTIGAWCFLDRFHTDQAEMQVDPHPHIGLQTVTWPLHGLVHHRDSVGSDVVLRPGELNLMTAGNGISHSEYSISSDDRLLDGVQLWVALPDGARQGPAFFEHYEDLPRVALPADAGGDQNEAEATAIVFMGTLAGVSSPARTFSPLVGAQLTLPPGVRVTVPLEPGWEHGVMVLHGDATTGAPVQATPAVNDLTYLAPGIGSVALESVGGATVLLIGGEPFGEDLVMWWNFVGRSHDEVAQAREDWESQSSRFGTVDGHGNVRIPAPPIPPVRMVPRRRNLVTDP